MEKDRNNRRGGRIRPANPEPTLPSRSLSPAYRTVHGAMYLGDSREVLPMLIERGERVKLIMTSPPYALLRKKAYGNEAAEDYVAWFLQFVEALKGILEPQGSLVLEIGGSWRRGMPARSTYHFELLLELERQGFYLAQDLYRYNPARLPTPAEWVCVRRLRLKDAVNPIWWLVRDPFVMVDNRRVLRPYSASMRTLMPKLLFPRRSPSGHTFGSQIGRDNGGAIPPNLLTFANTESNSYYLRQCRQNGLAVHPARFPRGLPEFFIKFLTEPGEKVLDPFAGSNVTGEAAELLGRQWLSVEAKDEYVQGSRFRFVGRISEAPAPETRQKAA